jgi:hypothetical protein
MLLANTSRRSGFTLLELLLASGIAIIVLGGLFMTMDTMLTGMDADREGVEKSSLARALIARINNDVTSSIAPIQPVASASSQSSPTTGGAAASTTTTTTSTTPALTFQVGVKGTSSLVAIFQTRMSRIVVTPPDDGNGNQNPYAGDVRRICYFLSSSPDRPGLARQEIRLVTAEQVDDVPTDPDEFTTILASGVTDFSVRYFDGTSWVDSWDGSTPGPDGMTPQGPPRAVEITLGIKLPGSDEAKTFKHTIAFLAAPGSASQSSTTTP